jgi:3',5'-cyclic AMP phosphodiesterase CpdA
MRVIAHISDLHFGTEDRAVVEGLCEALWRLRPSLIVNSGDLTQRARRKQFRAACEFAARLPGSQLIVPGNHDVPLFDVLRRFASPLGRYRRFIRGDLNPLFRDEELFVQGINTARSLTWKNGRISFAQMKLIERNLGGGTGVRFRVVVTHHPFIPPPLAQGKVELVGRATQTLEVLDRCKVDLLLAGHLHHGYTADVRTYHPATRRSMIVVQAGTAASRRVRNEPNAFNVITLDQDLIEISVRVWNGAKFSAIEAIRYRLHDNAWVKASEKVENTEIVAS